MSAAAPAGTPAGDPVRLVTFSSLYPNPAQPNHGVFVENRLRHLVASGEARSTVLAPVPWFPGRGPGAVPAEEQRHGLRVLHPRFLALPKLGLLTNPALLARAALPALERLAPGFDVLDAHYLFPDGVAAVRLARRLGKKVVITARGSDTSHLPRLPFAGPMIRAALREADALVAVSEGLKQGLLELGADAGKVTVLRNGVDTALFQPPADREALRAEMGLGAGPLLVSVGLLIPRKRHHLAIEALRHLPDHRLVILGEGPERAALEALAAREGVAGRVTLAGTRPHAELPRWYGAADAMVLASAREGWANVLLESMACGTPVVATEAWGAREAVSSPAAGRVVEASGAAIAEGVRQVAPLPRAATRAHAERFGWEETTRGQLSLFRRILEGQA
ncbi:glycosyltransferase [Roseococcus sp. DSY-14]|uniref:glycosyltransferase n=1 Tax=Roseococcus sp. DSY-14 TaxID=3369650 RepID=UPI00387AE515